MINGVELQEGDYAKLDPAADAQLSSMDGMEGICIQHGKALCGSDIFLQIKSASLKDDDARKLMKLPWIDHLRRQASPAETEILCDMIKHSPSESVRELCINIVRNINSQDLCGAVKGILESPSSLGMRISALLFLASKDKVGADEWAEQLKLLASDEDELIHVVSTFYDVNDLVALRQVIDQRIASGKYAYNHPLYELLIRVIDKKKKS
jgi:hypothetical protein